MRHAVALFIVIAVAGCDLPSGKAGKYTLVETSKGVVYRLDTSTGATEIIYSPEGWAKLRKKALYEGEDKRTYEYLGGGQLKELSTSEAADRLVEKYAK